MIHSIFASLNNHLALTINRICTWINKNFPESKRKIVLRFISLGLVLWVAHYLNFRSFGLYEDDYTFISKPLGWNRLDLINHFFKVFQRWPQGRPIGFSLPQLLAFLGGKTGSLSTLYIIGFLVHLVNACLFYVLLIKRTKSETIALIGALTFGLFPADTTHIFLMHSFGLHTSLTFLLIAYLLYSSRFKPFSYLSALASLLTYESPYMVFLIAPLFTLSWNRKLVKEFFRHAAAWFTILAMVTGIRLEMGEGRVSGTVASSQNIFLTFEKIGKSLFIGPKTSLSVFALVPRGAFLSLNFSPEIPLVFTGSILLFTLIFYVNKLMAFKKPVLSLGMTNSNPSPFKDTIELLITSLLMLSLAYGLSFTHFPPTRTYGRLSSVHLAATFGGSLLFACIISLALSLIKSAHYKIVAKFLLILYFALLVTYRYRIQLDFKQAWQNQQEFWTSVVEQMPDLNKKTAIFALYRDLPQTGFIQSNSWADPLILAQIYKFPTRWKLSPRLFVVPSEWETMIQRKGTDLVWETPAFIWPPHQEIHLPDSNVVLFEMENGKLTRKFGTIVIAGQKINLKPLSANSVKNLKKGPLYRYLILDSGKNE